MSESRKIVDLTDSLAVSAMDGMQQWLRTNPVAAEEVTPLILIEALLIAQNSVLYHLRGVAQQMMQKMDHDKEEPTPPRRPQ